MKRILPLMAACILSGASCFAASRFWIGPSNGNWNNTANWSAESEGAPGASVPGISDDVFFVQNAVVLMDITGSINSLTVPLMTNVTLYTGLPVSLTISGSLTLAPGSVLKDSTTQPVAFPVIFNPATNAGATIQGQWVFAGNNPANLNSEEGANFIAAFTNRVKVLPSSFAGSESKIILRQFAGNIIAADSALEFRNQTFFEVNGDRNPTIPNAKWDATSSILINGNISTVTHGGARPFYGVVTISLPLQSEDASFALPAGSEIRGLLSINNTNAHTLTVLAATGANNRVEAILRNSFQINGTGTLVAMAKATAAAPQTAYQLGISVDLIQTAGNFSLQDFNGVTGSSTLVVGRNLRQTAGTMITNSTATGTASFVLDMNYNFGSNFNSDIEQTIRMSSGTIDNAQHNVTLRINSKTEYTGVTLQSPLSTGRIEFIRGPLTTTAVNIITVNNPDPGAITTGTSNGFVNGPVRITTNSTGRYILPTGKLSTTMFPAYITPVTAATSVYQAEYFNSAYSDVTTVSPPLAGVAQRRYWNIQKISGSDVKVGLFLEAPLDGTSPNDLFVIARYANTSWVSAQGDSAVFGTQLPSSLTTRNLTAYGAFTFASINIGGGALPVKLTSFDAVKQNGGASIDWKAEELPSSFNIQRSLDGRSFVNIGSVTAVSAKSQYTYFDASLPQGFVYYRLQSVEKDGSTSFSKIATILNKELSAANTTLLPTLVNSYAKFSISGSKAGRLDLVVTDMLGRNVKQFQFAISTPQFETSIDLSSLKPGTYQVSSLVNGIGSGTVRFVKN